MTITIGYLYYDLMNLYGDIGNIHVLKYHLEKQGIKVNIKRLSIDDEINFKRIDLVYIGSSTEDNRFIALNHLLKYKDDIKDAIKMGKFFLITGQALAMFGNNIDDEKALGIFDFNTNISNDREVKEVVTNTKFVKDFIYGFLNNSDNISYNNCEYLFDNEGILDNNFYGTKMIGPLLVRNPMFTEYFIKKLIKSKYKDFKFKRFDFALDIKAYNEYIEFKRTKRDIK